MKKLNVLLIGKSTKFSKAALTVITANHSLQAIVESFHTPKSQSYFSARWAKLIYEIKSRTLFPKLKRFASMKKIPYFRLTNKNSLELESFVKTLAPDVIVVASCSQKLKEGVFSLPPLGTINIHPSLLPKYRGPDPIFWTVYNEEPEGGVTIHLIDAGQDTGPIILQESFPIVLGETLSSIEAKVQAATTKLLALALDSLAKGDVQTVSQPVSSPTCHARYVNSDEQFIDWTSWPIERSFHVLRGIHKRFRPLSPPIRWLHFIDWQVIGFSKASDSGKPGNIYRDSEGYFVAHAEGKIRLIVGIVGTHHRTQIEKVL